MTHQLLSSHSKQNWFGLRLQDFPLVSLTSKNIYGALAGVLGG